jgi:hypothetical protein
MENRRTVLTLKDIDNYWAKNYLKSIAKAIGSGVHEKERDITCWSMFYSKMKNSSYEYLTKYGDYSIPVNVRFHSIVKPNIDWLVSKYLSNPFNFSIKTVDKKSLNKKYKSKIDQYVESITRGIEEKYLGIQTQLELIGNKQQELNMMLQQQPEYEEHAKQLEQIKQQMPMISMKLTQMTNALKRELKRTSESMDNADLLSRFKPKDIREDLLQRKMVSFYENNNIGNEHKWSVTDKFVSGKPYLFVDIDETGKLEYRHLPSNTVSHAKSSSIPEVENGDWAAYEEYWSYDKLMNKFGKDFTAEDLMMLQTMSPHKTNYLSSTFEKYEDSDEGAANYVINYKPTISRNNIRVLRVFWQSSIEIEILKSRIPGSNYDLTKIKKDKDRVRENQKIESRFKTYLFEGYVIMDCIYVGIKMRDKQVLKVDNYGWNQLPIIGDNFDDISRVPYSIIWATKDLQAMYQIIEYYEELLLVISGVKGFVMDKSQMPSGMDEKEFAYYRKLGTIWLESYKKDRRQQTTFNQFQTFDDSIPASIQYLGVMKDRIQQRVDQITGVTRFARGEMQERDAVGNSKLSVQATNIISDVMFWEHDQIIRRALTRAMNLYAKYIGKDGEVFSIFDKTIGDNDTINIPSGLLDGADYDAIIMNNNKDVRDIQELKQIIATEYSRGSVDMSGMIKVFQSTSITEMRLLAEQMAEKAQLMQQQMQNNQLEGEKALKEFDAQLEMKLKEGDLQLKNMDNQLKQFDLELKNKEIEMHNAIETKKLESQAWLKSMEIAAKIQTDKDRLDAEQRSVAVDQALKELELKLNAILQGEKNMIDDKKLDKRVNKQ